MGITISPEQLQSTIQNILHEIPQKVDNVIDEAAAKVSKEAVKTLKTSGPSNKGRYRRGWATKKQGKKIYVYNRTDASLTHLLEHGHDLISHNKKVGHVDGQEHIKPVEDKVIERMTEEVEKGIDKL